MSGSHEATLRQHVLGGRLLDLGGSGIGEGALGLHVDALREQPVADPGHRQPMNKEMSMPPIASETAPWKKPATLVVVDRARLRGL